MRAEEENPKYWEEGGKSAQNAILSYFDQKWEPNLKVASNKVGWLPLFALDNWYYHHITARAIKHRDFREEIQGQWVVSRIANNVPHSPSQQQRGALSLCKPIFCIAG